MPPTEIFSRLTLGSLRIGAAAGGLRATWSKSWKSSSPASETAMSAGSNSGIVDALCGRGWCCGCCPAATAASATSESDSTAATAPAARQVRGTSLRSRRKLGTTPNTKTSVPGPTRDGAVGNSPSEPQVGAHCEAVSLTVTQKRANDLLEL